MREQNSTPSTAPQHPGTCTSAIPSTSNPRGSFSSAYKPASKPCPEIVITKTENLRLHVFVSLARCSPSLLSRTPRPRLPVSPALPSPATPGSPVHTAPWKGSQRLHQPPTCCQFSFLILLNLWAPFDTAEGLNMQTDSAQSTYEGRTPTHQLRCGPARKPNHKRSHRPNQ